MFQNYVQDVLNVVDGSGLKTGVMNVVSQAAIGSTCRIRGTADRASFQIELDSSRNSMVTYDFIVRVSEVADIDIIASVVDSFNGGAIDVTGSPQTYIPVLPAINVDTADSSYSYYRVVGAINVPRRTPAVSVMSVVIGVGSYAYIYGVARAHYTELLTYQPSK